MEEVNLERRCPNYQSSPKCMSDNNKRKCGFGSAGKERKRQHDWQGWGSQESLERSDISQEDYPELDLFCDSVFDKPSFGQRQRNLSWADMIEDEENSTVSEKQQENRSHPIYKKRLVLSEIQKQNKRPAQKSKSQNSSPRSNKQYKDRPILKDQHKLKQRQKQLDIGKNTLGYGKYLKEIAREKRMKDDPQTPDKYQCCSTRSWQGQMKLWRRCLHIWDPSELAGKDDPFASSISFNSEGDVIDSDSGPEESISTGSQDCSADEGVLQLNEEDLFKNLDLESCLSNDGYPL